MTKILFEGMRLSGKSSLISEIRKFNPSVSVLENRAGSQALTSSDLKRNIHSTTKFIESYIGEVVFTRGPLSGFAEHGLEEKEMRASVQLLVKSGVIVVFLNMDYETYLQRLVTYSVPHDPIPRTEFEDATAKYCEISRSCGKDVVSVKSNHEDYLEILREVTNTTKYPEKN